MDQEFIKTGQFGGDFKNSKEMKKENRAYGQQVIGNRTRKRADIRAAFGLSNS